jgi:hypothetical protein
MNYRCRSNKHQTSVLFAVAENEKERKHGGGRSLTNLLISTVLQKYFYYSNITAAASITAAVNLMRESIMMIV